ncbi:MAG: hypothetical protein WCJ18_09120, partial [Planctomycetota bacterium]
MNIRSFFILSGSALLTLARRHSGRRTIAFIAAAIIAILSSSPAVAATWYWNTATGGWATGANWSNSATSGGTTGTVPLTTDSVVFNQSSVNGGEAVQISTATTIAGLTFANTGTTLLSSNNSTPNALTIGSGGITVNAGAGAVTLGDVTNAMPITLGAAQTWTNNSASLLSIVNNVTNGGYLLTIAGTGNTTISGVVGTGAGGLTKLSSGTLTLAAANTYT